MNVGARGLREPPKKIFHQFGLKIADQRGGNFRVNHAIRPPAKVDGRHRQRFVHGHHKIAGAQNSAFISQAFNASPRAMPTSSTVWC